MFGNSILKHCNVVVPDSPEVVNTSVYVRDMKCTVHHPEAIYEFEPRSGRTWDV